MKVEILHMEPNWRFTLLTFPQFFDGNILKLNIVVLPRNQNPLSKAIEGDPTIPEAPSFAEANFSFEARIITHPDVLASTSPSKHVLLAVSKPSNVKKLFEVLGDKFEIKNKAAQNTFANINSPLDLDRIPEPLEKERSVKKYLPLSYRKSFNFIAPRTENAVKDDSYHCAVRDAKLNPTFPKSSEEISWGRVF